jgi:hypothetical protein
MATGTVTTHSCDKHLDAYFKKGWKREKMLCNYCVINTATRFTTDGDSFCEPCEQKLLAEQPLCSNKDTAHGCLVHCGESLCEFCKRWLMNPRVRLINNSARACAITPGCAGMMHASVRRIAKEKPELHWHCTTCQTSKRADRSFAIPDPRATTAQDEEAAVADLAEQLNSPLSAEAAEMTAHIRGMLNEAD